MATGNRRRGYCALTALCVLLCRVSAATDGSAAPSAHPSVHTVFCTECTPYFAWQSMGVVYSHARAGQPGPLTRLMSCTPEQHATLSEEYLALAPTHIAPSFSTHPRTGDIYSAYNKPEAIIDWLQRAPPEEDYVLVLDADMLLRRPFLPHEIGARPGRAVSALYSYLKGVNNALAMKHIPHVRPRTDSLAGPPGRRSDQVGGFIMMAAADLARMAPDWLAITEDVRADPDAWNLTGDVYSTAPHSKPWISEMYGYSYSAAKHDIWHTTLPTAMLYPGYLPQEEPWILHYGLHFEVQGYGFDKHWHVGFNAFMCPPWPAPAPQARPRGGLFPQPPSPSTLPADQPHLERLRDLLAIETVSALNQALCRRHVARCPASAELSTRCGQVMALAREVEDALQEVLKEGGAPCEDMDKYCGDWAEHGECEKNPGFMSVSCRPACHLCAAAQQRTNGNTGETLPGIPRSQDGEAAIEAVRSDAISIGDDCLLAYKRGSIALEQVYECMHTVERGDAYLAPTSTEQQPQRSARSFDTDIDSAGSQIDMLGLVGLLVWVAILSVLLALWPRSSRSVSARAGPSGGLAATGRRRL
mmetsp:Transcript_18843/g.47580  ORF Transcript_18843/g.47580 Transcript_18843/m.47580 type:complete len:587 (-) Transcript_18843:329-2089(-)